MIDNTSRILAPHLHLLVCLDPTVFKSVINLPFPEFVHPSYHHTKDSASQKGNKNHLNVLLLMAIPLVYNLDKGFENHSSM